MKADYKRLISFIRGGEVLPNENHHSEGAAGKAAYHRQCCSDGMLSHQGEFSWAIPRQDPTTPTNALRRHFNSVRTTRVRRLVLSTTLPALNITFSLHNLKIARKKFPKKFIFQFYFKLRALKSGYKMNSFPLRRQHLLWNGWQNRHLSRQAYCWL